METKTQMKVRQKYIEKNGGLENVFNDKLNKDRYERFLTKVLTSLGELDKPSIRWTQKRSKK